MDVKIQQSEIDFLNSKYEELLQNGGIILLEPMKQARIDNIIKFLEQYKNMTAFVIGEENKKRIVLRYYPKEEKQIYDINKIVNDAKKAYAERNYYNCIELNLILLKTFHRPGALLYIIVGLSYYKLHDKKKALDYLIVGSEISKKERKRIDVDDLIMRLSSKVPEEDLKPQFKVKPVDLNNSDTNDYYGITNFDNINDVVNQTDLDVETVCHMFNISEIDINIVKLIYAREYYLQGDMAKGDEFLHSVEKSPFKNDMVIKIYNTIQQNKRCYQHRDVHRNRELRLTTIPRLK